MVKNFQAYVEVPLGQEAHRLAGEFAREQSTAEKSKKVYLNTLAVYAAHRYLKWLNIETDLQQSDCWHPLLRSRWDVADLSIPEVGKLECCVVLPGETAVSLDQSTLEERLGYLAIQFSEQLDRVQIVGFAQINRALATLPVSSFQPIETFFRYLENPKPSAVSEPESPLVPHEPERSQPPNLLTRMAQEAIDVGRWFQTEMGNWALEAPWFGLSEPTLATEFRDTSTYDFDAILLQLQRKYQIKVPPRAATAYRDIKIASDRLRLYVTTWPLDESPEADRVLLLVLGTIRGIELTQTVELAVRDREQVLVERGLEPSRKKQNYQVVQLAGKADEQFLVTVTDRQGANLVSCLVNLSGGLSQ